MAKTTIRIRRAHSCLAAMTLLPGLLACGSEPPSILATYAGGEITHEEYAAWLAYKNREAEPERQQANLQAIAMTEALAAGAFTAGADREPQVQFTVAVMEGRQLAAALRRWAADSVKISEEEVEAALEENRDRLVKPPRRRLYNLFKKVPSGASAVERQAIRDEIAAIRRQLMAGADFDAMARRESDSQTRFQGGYMGLAKPGQLPAPLEEAVFRLEPGEISPILEGPEGFTLIKCDAIFAGRTMPVDEAREKIRQTLRRRAVNKTWQAMEQELLEEAPPQADLRAVRQQSADEEAVVVRFGDRVVTRREVTWLLAGLARRPSPDTLRDERLRALLQQHVLTCLAADRARSLGLDEDPALRNRLRWKRLEILAGEELRRRVAAEFVPPQEDEIRAYFAAHPERFVHPEAYRLAAIRIPLAEASLVEEYRRAEALLARLRAGDLSFAQAAREFSQHPTAAAGGELGWRIRRQIAAMGPAVHRTIIEMKPGALSELVEQDENLWIFKLLDFRPQRPMRFEEASLGADRALGNERLKALQQEIEKKAVAELKLRLADPAAPIPQNREEDTPASTSAS